MKRIRQLDITEYSSWCIEQTTRHNCAIVLSLSSTQSCERIELAIQHLVDSYDCLRACIRDSNRLLYFVEEPSKVYIEHVDTTDSKYIEERVCLELNRPFELSKAPFLRAIHFRDEVVSKVAFIIQHAILDAFSMVHMANDFLRCLSSGYRIPNHKFPKPIVEHLNIKNDLTPHVFSNSSDFPPQDGQTRMISAVFDSESLDNINQSLTSKGLSLHDYLTASCALAIRSGMNSGSEMLMYVPYDLRRYFNNTHEEIALGFYATCYTEILTVNEDACLVDLAEKIGLIKQKKLDKDAVMTQLTDFQELLNKLTDANEVVDSMRSKYPGFGISNVGKVGLQSNYGNFELEDVSFSYNCHGFYRDPNSFSLVVSSYQNRLRLNLHYSCPWVSYEKASYFLQSIVKCLHAL